MRAVFLDHPDHDREEESRGYTTEIMENEEASEFSRNVPSNPISRSSDIPGLAPVLTFTALPLVVFHRRVVELERKVKGVEVLSSFLDSLEEEEKKNHR